MPPLSRVPDRDDPDTPRRRSSRGGEPVGMTKKSIFPRITAPVLLIALIAASVITALPAKAGPVPEGATWEEVYFESGDGTMLHADVLRPKGLTDKDKTPVIVSIGPYFNTAGFVADPYDPTAEGPNPRFDDLWEEGKIFQRGYSYVQVDLRGFGGSDGCTDFGGPGEQMDSKAAVEWAASQPWSTGKVGMWGKSYDAWTQVMALSQKPKGLAAAVIQAPIIEGFRTLYQNGVHYDSGWYATPSLYTLYDLTPPSTNSEPEEFVNYARGAVSKPNCYADQTGQTGVPDRTIEYWQQRDIVKAAGASAVPVLWSHGFLDANTKPDNFLDVYSKLNGPKRAWFGQFDHVRGNEANFVGREGFMDEAMRWFDTYLKGKSPAQTGVSKDPKVEVQQSVPWVPGQDGRWRFEAQWPPADASRSVLPVREGTYQDVAGNSAAGTEGDDAGIGVWSISQKLPYDVHMAGVPKIKVPVTPLAPRVNLIGLLYDIDAQGKGTLISRGAYAVTEAGDLGFELYPQDWKVLKGHRIGMLVSGSDDMWYTPPFSGTDVTIAKGQVTLPFLKYVRNKFVSGKPATAMSSRPVLQITPETIEQNAVKLQLPGKMVARGDGSGEQQAGGGTSPRLKAPAVRMYAQPRDPQRGQMVRFHVRLKACSRGLEAEGTRILLKRKTADGYKVIAEQRLSPTCNAVFAKRANFDRATFKASWPKQRAGYRKGRSLPVEVTTLS